MSPCDVSVSFVCVFFCLFFFHTSLSTISPAYLQKFLFQRGKLPYSYTRHTIPTNRKSCPRALCCNSTQCWEELCSGHLALLHQHLQYRDWLYETDVFLLVAFPYLNDVCSVFLSDPGKVYRNKKVKKKSLPGDCWDSFQNPPPSNRIKWRLIENWWMDGGCLCSYVGSDQSAGDSQRGRGV